MTSPKKIMVRFKKGHSRHLPSLISFHFMQFGCGAPLNSGSGTISVVNLPEVCSPDVTSSLNRCNVDTTIILRTQSTLFPACQNIGRLISNPRLNITVEKQTRQLGVIIIYLINHHSKFAHVHNIMTYPICTE